MPPQSFEGQRSKMLTEVEQLRIHCGMERMKVSKSVQGLIEYCRDNLQADPLYCPVKENPFKEKKSCTIL